MPLCYHSQAELKGNLMTLELLLVHLQAAAQEVAKAHAGVDLLINNAGIDEGIGPILET